VLLAAQDLTTVRRLETVRRDFVANVSHELRTPIASLKAMAEALEGGALDEPAAARDFVSRMHREIDELAQLVEELLGLARIEGGADLRLERVGGDELVEPVLSRLRPLADRAGVSLELDGRAATPVLADRERIGQVLSNLVHNAVKFTPRGGHVSVGTEDGADLVRFVVRDTGIGIAREDLDRIFERFFKAERSRATGGTGLGLAIAKHVVQAHGGSITAESAGPGRGSTFSFTLPRADRA
jgi:two-component system phosphate regulon sensor histidine kinase PhoR